MKTLKRHGIYINCISNIKESYKLYIKYIHKYYKTSPMEFNVKYQDFHGIRPQALLLGKATEPIPCESE